MCSCIMLNSDTPPGSLGIGTWISGVWLGMAWLLINRLGHDKTGSLDSPSLWLAFSGWSGVCLSVQRGRSELRQCRLVYVNWRQLNHMVSPLQSDIRVWAGVGGPSPKQAAGRWCFIGALRTPEWDCSALGSVRPRVFFSFLSLQWMQHHSHLNKLI